MNTFDWNRETLLQLSGHYWQTCTLHAGVKLDIFTALGSAELTADNINEKLRVDKRGLVTLLNALSAMALLEKRGEKYTNSPGALTYLSKESPQYIGFMIMHHHHLMDSWQKIDRAVTEGRPVRSRPAFSDEARRESFLMGMFNIAMAVAPALSEKLDLSGCRRLLDLGGGPGTFAIHFCLANPALEATVVDLETTRPFAEKTIKRFNIEDRVTFAAGDYIEDGLAFSHKFDAAWLSHVLHGEGPRHADIIIGKAVSALNPGGMIFIHDFILDDTMASPLFPALFSINMYLGTDEGRSYSQKQISDMLKQHGVKDVQRLDFEGPTQSGILQGTVSP